MVHINQCCLDGNGFLPIEKDGSIFGFGVGGHDIAQYFEQDKDEPVENWGVLSKCESVRIGLTEEEDAIRMTALFGEVKVQCITVD